MKINAIILAAGRGTRMKSELPKCAYPVCGKPMISYILDACKNANVDDICVVVGHKKEVFEEMLKGTVSFAYQEEQLGTGHAIKCAKEFYQNKEGITLIFPGDMPLIDTDTIKGLIANHLENKNDLTVVTTIVDDPFGYGRIYKENSQIIKIIEEKEATLVEKEIKEINTGLYCINTNLLFSSVDLIKNDNNKGEYYLTDIVEILGKIKKVNSYIVPFDFKLTGINDVMTLKKVEEEYQQQLTK